MLSRSLCQGVVYLWRAGNSEGPARSRSGRVHQPVLASPLRLQKPEAALCACRRAPWPVCSTLLLCASGCPTWWPAAHDTAGPPAAAGPGAGILSGGTLAGSAATLRRGSDGQGRKVLPPLSDERQSLARPRLVRAFRGRPVLSGSDDGRSSCLQETHTEQGQNLLPSPWRARGVRRAWSRIPKYVCGGRVPTMSAGPALGDSQSSACKASKRCKCGPQIRPPAHTGTMRRLCGGGGTPARRWRGNRGRSGPGP